MKVLYVTTISNTINAFLIPHIKLLLDQGYKVDIACNVHNKISDELIKCGCKIYNVKFQRSPLRRENFEAYKRLKQIIQKEDYSLIHTHTPVASALVRLACRYNKNIKVVYTAHGFHFFNGAPIRNWLLYYPVEILLSRYTDVIITINKEDYKRAQKFAKSSRVEYLPSVGIDTNKFKNILIDRSLKRKEIGVPEDAFVILSVGELNENKNHETVIKAISLLKNPNVYYVICGKGALEDYLRSLASDLGIEKQIKLLGFRKDIGEICKASDVFAFPSKREGLGMAALEAMACGLPIVTSNVHGITDYSVNNVTGYSCDPLDIEGFSEAFNILLKNKSIRNQMGQINSESVKEYDLSNTLLILKKLYNELDSDL